jgi:hypothetical protein
MANEDLETSTKSFSYCHAKFVEKAITLGFDESCGMMHFGEIQICTEFMVWPCGCSLHV